MNEMKQNDGGPAFPCSNEQYTFGNPQAGDAWAGMTLRDWFAGLALQGILAGPASRDGVPIKEWFDAPDLAYRLADAMLTARAALSRATAS